MIAHLKGTLAQVRPPHLVVDVGGVGYLVEAPLSTIAELPHLGQPVQLLIHAVFKDDAHTLYGFARDADRELFQALLKVSGVGGKLGLAILSGMNADEFARLVNDGDVAALTRLPGVGKKTAERLIVEMRDRLEGLGLETRSGAATPAAASAGSEATAALVALGYKQADAARLVRRHAEEDMDTEAIVRAVLKGAVAS